MHGLSWEEVAAIVQGLEQIRQPYLSAELALLQATGQRLQYDGDLTGLPVANTSRSYPNATFSHMDDNICLGYQAGVVSLRSPTYGRLWLAIVHHPGDTVSCTQAAALVAAAEAQTGRGPKWRTALLAQRIQALEQQLTQNRQTPGGATAATAGTQHPGQSVPAA